MARQLANEGEIHCFAVAAHTPVGDRIEVHIHRQIVAQILQRECQTILLPLRIRPPLRALGEEIEQQLARVEQALCFEQPLHVSRFSTFRLLAHLLQ